MVLVFLPGNEQVAVVCDLRCVHWATPLGIKKQNCPLFSCKIQNSKKKFRHLHGELNLDEIKNALHNLPVNRETNLMSLINPSLEVIYCSITVVI